ncbi:glycosyltransferase family 2 protein [Marinifilum fragile]|uniref:glycosyltransferase family 2 protein n=1 Tax=Marinifilum fragile TaxID=570161 RepID=UPI002AA91214|nr:glycosyltransferase family 2 protein [Marinifilum fragile]
MKFSTAIIVSTYNWPKALELSIKSVFKQTILPNEIIIADDGSKSDTTQLIEELRNISPIEIKHVWHEDSGFRKTMIMNKGFAMCESDYIIQIDGDIILHKKFVQDHIEIAESGYFVSGKRAYINKKESLKLQVNPDKEINFFALKDKMQVVRLPHFFNFRRLSNSKNPNKGIKGSNMAFWKKDIVNINGYDEELKMWGYEDKEIAARLINSGVLKKRVRYRCLSYHLYHKIASKENLQFHQKVLDRTIDEKLVTCEKGLSQYMK